MNRNRPKAIDYMLGKKETPILQLRDLDTEGSEGSTRIFDLRVHDLSD